MVSDSKDVLVKDCIVTHHRGLELSHCLKGLACCFEVVLQIGSNSQLQDLYWDYK
jgi:hypothetical protein